MATFEQQLKAETEHQAREGLRGPHPLWVSCNACSLPFKFGSADSGANVYSMAGARETQISGMCEKCFDELFAEDED